MYRRREAIGGNHVNRRKEVKAMLNSSTLMVVALTTLMPTQAPQAPVVYGPAPAGTVVGGYFQGPVPAPYATGAPFACEVANAGACDSCSPGWNLEAKLRKLCQFITYRPAYKTPCCFKTCSSYRPPLYEWFPTCVEGAPSPMPCMASGHGCGSGFRLGNIRFAPPPGGSANCPTGTCR